MRRKEPESPVEDWTGVFGTERTMLKIKRDDLLPFPLAGNKFRKLSAEFTNINPQEHVIVTVGSVTSNHCRTTAMLAAKEQIPVRLVLHDESLSKEAKHLGERLLSDLGATYSIVRPTEIKSEIETAEKEIRAKGKTPYVIAGGCHTTAGVRAYIDAMHELARQIDTPPDLIVVASGTGATQAGLVVGCKQLDWPTKILGVSVARGAERGAEAVLEAVHWLDSGYQEMIEFTDQYTAGGYGKSDATITEAVRRAWNKGLPLDRTYTGKAFAAVLDTLGSQESIDQILFWHTGGLLQYLSEGE